MVSGASRAAFLVAALLASIRVEASSEERIDRLPEVYRKWLLEEVNYIISDREKETFLNLESEQEREGFVDAFWRKRDENPSTPENEYREEHYRRLEYVDNFFGRDTFLPGWRTDRGRFYILLGAPRSRQNFEGRDQVYPAELWSYNNPELKSYGLPPVFYLLFFRRHGVGEFQLYDPIGDGPQSLMTRVSTKSMDFRADVERAYNELQFIDPELAQASLSFTTDEGDVVQFQATPFGTVKLLADIAHSPLYGVDTSYANRLDFERGAVESDYLFRFVPSSGMISVVPGPAGAWYLHWVIEIEPQHVGFVQDKETQQYSSQFIASVEIESKSVPGKLLVQDRKESYVNLKPSEAASLHLPVSHSWMTPMVPGDYTLRVILRNRACPGRDDSSCLKGYALLDGEFSVPPSSEAPILGDLIPASHAELRGGEPSYRSYRFGTIELVPNPSGVYAIGDTMVAAVVPRNAPSEGSIRFQLESADAEGVVPIDQTVPLDGDRPAVTEISLQGLDPGRFRLTAVLLDAKGRELDRKLVPITLSPRTSILRPAVRGSLPQIRPELPGIVATTLGEQCLALGREDDSRGLFEQAVSANGKLGPPRERLASMALAAGESARAIELLEPVYAQVKDRFEILSILGQAYFNEQRFREAVDVLERAIALKRPEPTVLNVLANANYRVGNLDRAQELLEQSLALDPNQETVREILSKLKAERAGKGP
jgi:GWxTD domain-containing protein